MPNSSNCWPEIAESISRHTAIPFKINNCMSVGGGCINAAWCVEGHGQTYFVKLNDVGLHDMFVAEADGLRELAVGVGPRVPIPVCDGVTGDQAFLVLEYIEFGVSQRGSAPELGERLACLHEIKKPYFGWHRDNNIGTTAQINTISKDWVSFFSEFRLKPQLSLASSNGFDGDLQVLGEELLEWLPALFSDYRPSPSVLHGDLWGGNHGVDTAGHPVIYDPAVYFGDRETDLAMTELFGGFTTEFYTAYNSIFPLDAGYRQRKTLYNLYHILNHLNLFGAGYLAQALSMQRQLLSELR